MCPQFLRFANEGLTRKQSLAGSREDVTVVMRDPNKLSEILPVVDQSLESVELAV